MIVVMAMGGDSNSDSGDTDFRGGFGGIRMLMMVLSLEIL